MESVPVEPEALAQQVESYAFEVRFPGSSFPSLAVDEPAPIGSGRGPSPVRVLAAAVAHCLSSTFYNCVERAHVPVAPLRTTVRATVGPNPRGRRRVLGLAVTIETAPLREEDRSRFERCVSIFEDFCTVSGAVREGIRIDTGVVGPVPPSS